MCKQHQVRGCTYLVDEAVLCSLVLYVGNAASIQGANWVLTALAPAAPLGCPGSFSLTDPLSGALAHQQLCVGAQ